MIDRRALEIRRRKGKRQLKRWQCREVTLRRIGKAGTTPAPCSCWMCGNPRRKMKGKERLTIQEKRELHGTDTGTANNRMGFLSGETAVPDDFDSIGKEEIRALFAGGGEPAT